MSQFSEIMGSFIRTGNYPFEANYIFPTETALREFFNDPTNLSILHKGLFRIVENGGNEQQALYWVTKNLSNNRLEFTKLIENLDIAKINEQFEIIKTKLEEIGETNTVISDLQKELEIIRQEYIDFNNDLKDQLKSTVGTTDDNIAEYLATLPYQSLTCLALTLDRFLNKSSDSSNIETLPELLSFLKGYTNSDNLSKLLSNLLKNIQGDPLPSEEFGTLKKIEEFSRKLHQFVKDRTRNLLTELDQTLVGVGLDSSGSYSPDHETNYLRSATSVMNALKILDGKIKDAANGVNSVLELGYYDPSREAIILTFKGLDTTESVIPVSSLITEWQVSNDQKAVILEKHRVEGGGPDILSADVKISTKEDNILTKDMNSLYVPKFNDTELRDLITNLEERISSLAEKSYVLEELHNLDSKYLTLSSLDEYITETLVLLRIDTAIGNIVFPEPDLSSLESRLDKLELKPEYDDTLLKEALENTEQRLSSLENIDHTLYLKSTDANNTYLRKDLFLDIDSKLEVIDLLPEDLSDIASTTWIRDNYTTQKTFDSFTNDFEATKLETDTLINNITSKVLSLETQQLLNDWYEE